MTDKTENSEQSKQLAESRPVEALVIPHPYLFANGKFYAKVERATFLIAGITRLDEGFPAFVAPRASTIVKVPYNLCKLIARPIFDMNDKEINKFKRNIYDYFPNESVKRYLQTAWNDGKTLDADEMLYLLSIGIYPFNQADFKQDWLIDASAV